MGRDEVKRITIQIEDGISPREALGYLHTWILNHELDPKNWPMTGLFSNDKMLIEKRDYRKTDCFRIVKRKANK